MNKRDIELLIEWNFWATKKILDKAARLTDAQFVAPQPAGFSAGSLRGTLVHTLSAEWAWRMRLQHGVSPSAFLSAREFPNLSALILRWATEEDRLREYVAGLSDADLQREVQYKNMAGEARVHTLGHALTHVTLHGHQHRSECAAMLTNFEQSPGNIDFIYYLIDKNIA
jgi:uncharacterized damage-inducible protein DinB